jgi:hypothetical protein
MAGAHAHTGIPLHRPRHRRALRGGRLDVLVQLAGVLLALAVIAAFVALILSARQQRGDARAVALSTETVAQIGRVERLALDRETAIRGYVITGQEPFRRPTGTRASATRRRPGGSSRSSTADRPRARWPSGCCATAWTTRSGTRTG